MQSMQHAVLAKAADIMPVHAISALTLLALCGQLAVKATDITQNCGIYMVCCNNYLL
jgi:hypothetical protein